MIVGFVVFAVVLFAVWILALQWAWNMVMPAVFDLPTIDYGQAAALALLLSAISAGSRAVRSRD